MHTGTLRDKPTSELLTLGELGQKVMMIAGIVGVVSLIAALAVAATSGEWFRQFSFAYLVSFCFYCTISIGGLFFVVILHLTRGGWGVSVRRIAELLAMNIITMLILFLPILIPVLAGFQGLYSWNGVVEDALIQGKQPYLNGGFFSLRALVYFAIWGLMAFFFFKTSLAQDESGDPKLTLKMQARSAPFAPLFALALIFSSFDWEMSLQPAWFSTMFPVYIFAGAFLGAICTILLLSVLLQKSGRLTEDITTDNYHDLSKLAFAFVVFWGYIAFSQYLLIWYANIPEETFWYKIRQENGWTILSLVLIVGHLLIPLLGIMARTVRRNKTFMFFAVIYLLAMHYIDHFWLIMPAFDLDNHSLPLSFANIATCLLCFVGIGGIYLASFCLFAGGRALIPMQDPRMVESLNYTNP